MFNENIYLQEFIAPVEISWYLYKAKDDLPSSQWLSKIRPEWDSKIKYCHSVKWNLEMTATETALVLGHQNYC